jgi:hypothetical protein
MRFKLRLTRKLKSAQIGFVTKCVAVQQLPALLLDRHLQFLLYILAKDSLSPSALIKLPWKLHAPRKNYVVSYKAQETSNGGEFTSDSHPCVALLISGSGKIRDETGMPRNPSRSSLRTIPSLKVLRNFAGPSHHSYVSCLF